MRADSAAYQADVFNYCEETHKIFAIGADQDAAVKAAIAAIPEGEWFYGYKNHVNANARHKLIRQYDVTDASLHDSRKFDGLLNQANTSSDVYADSAYRSAETEAKLSLRGLRSRIHHRANRNHPLSQAQENANRQKSRVRARIEHVFGAQQNSPGGRLVRTIGIARAKAKIGLQNLAYNMRRLVTLERMAAA